MVTWSVAKSPRAVEQCDVDIQSISQSCEGAKPRYKGVILEATKDNIEKVIEYSDSRKSYCTEKRGRGKKKRKVSNISN
ncbi:hypothetical protein TNCV_1430851 [Trichonephila clavipes]|nr:hypothetical protein TNCV_1430851 [Trichonephila clavipes]